MLVFIHINKTGGRTVRYILRSSFGLRHCEVEPRHGQWSASPFTNEDLQRLRKIYPHLESIAGHPIKGYIALQEDATKFQYFTFLREPLKTCASRFQYNVTYRGKKDLVFEEWIQKGWARNAQTKAIAGVEDPDKAIQIIREKNIFVGLTERFDESMVMLKGLVENNLNISYKRVNVAENNFIKNSLLSNEATHELLFEANQADLELYEYVQRELYPCLQQEYGLTLERDLRSYRQNQNKDFNKWNLTLSRLKQYLLYKSMHYLYRREIKFV